MKIAVLSSHTPSLFWFRMDMMKCFIDRGYQVVAIGNEDVNIWGLKFLESNIRYLQADIQRNGTNPIKDLHTLYSLKRILREEKPDKIFTYQAKTVIYGGIAAHQLGINEVYSLIAGVGSVFLSSGLMAKILQFILKTEYRFGIKHSLKVFFQNQDDMTLFVEQNIVPKEKIVMIHGSGVSLEKFTIQPLPDKPVFLCISRLIRDKGVIEYLQAARVVKGEYPDTRFLLVGPFDTNPSSLKPQELYPYIDDGIIEYFGEQSDVRPYLAQCSIFVLPSYREGTPKTVLEAMASNKAIITSNAPGCRETVNDGVNGFLVPIKDVKALVDAMYKLIKNPELIPKMALAGRKIVEATFDVKNINQTICKTMNI